MNTAKIVKYAKICNIVLIVTTLVMFILFRICNGIVNNGGMDFSARQTAYNAENIALWVYRAIGIAAVVVSIMLMIKSKNTQVKGIPLLLVSAIVSAVFAILGMMLGIVIWITSAISLKQLGQSISEDTFRDRLNKEDALQQTRESDGTEQ